MLNEGQGRASLAGFMKTKSKSWLEDFAGCFASDGIYCECIMSNAVREAILQELKLRN